MTAKQKYGNFKLEQLQKHPAMVIFPYAIMSFGITEIYASAIPLFAPSLKFYVDHKMGEQVRFQHYCPGFAPIGPHESNSHPFSPDAEDYESRKYWAQFADFYKWKYITYFDSLDDLIAKLQRTDFSTIRKKMVKYNKRRRVRILREWDKVIGIVNAYN